MLDPDLNAYEIIIPATPRDLGEIAGAMDEAEITNCKIQQSYFFVDGEGGGGFELTVYTEMDSAYGILYKLGETLSDIPYFIVDGEKWENRFATVLA